MISGVSRKEYKGPVRRCRIRFVCYINDMSISIDQECKLILYADDSAILFSHKDSDVVSNNDIFDRKQMGQK